jgi:hypothetical protein
MKEQRAVDMSLGTYTCYSVCVCRAGRNHVNRRQAYFKGQNIVLYGVYTVFWQENHQLYGVYIRFWPNLDFYVNM